MVSSDGVGDGVGVDVGVVVGVDVGVDDGVVDGRTSLDVERVVEHKFVSIVFGFAF